MLLFTGPDRIPTAAAMHQLQTLEGLDRPAVAARDLHLRSAGDLLGKNQAEHPGLSGPEL